MSADEFQRLLKRVVEGDTLDAEASRAAFAAIMTGEISDTVIASFLTAFAMRKPTVAEIVGAVRAMRAAMRTVEPVAHAIDLCGTGGDGRNTLNVSTAAAFVVAAAGIPVAKHGNRNMSSKSGTADVIEALGARLDLEPEDATACLRETGVCFLYAQAYHPAIKYAAPVRRELGFRTVFNLFGPLCNPAQVKRQLVGVFAEEWLEPLAEALRELGSDKAWVVHGGDGLDELTTTDKSHIAVLEGGRISRREISPRELGLNRATLAALRGGTAAENAEKLKSLLAGGHGAYRDIVILNSAAALVVAGRASDLKTGLAMAATAIDKGAAAKTLERFIAFTKKAAP
jgi:anthranilate phosphoribosyltransferase